MCQMSACVGQHSMGVGPWRTGKWVTRMARTCGSVPRMDGTARGRPSLYVSDFLTLPTGRRYEAKTSCALLAIENVGVGQACDDPQHKPGSVVQVQVCFPALNSRPRCRQCHGAASNGPGALGNFG